jgi:AmmeMemoRadiSam system protein A
LNIVDEMVTILRMVTEEEKRTLLGIARGSILQALLGRGSRAKAPEASTESLPERLRRPGGAFVTIRHAGELRGCIGYIESPLPLATVVAEVAEKAAFHDPRFQPLGVREAEEMVLEVSILSPLEPITSVEEIKVGYHGLLIEQGFSRGLLLPQVAQEYGWTREELLEHTARKAGLGKDAWKDPASTLYIFSADIVREEVHA